MKISKYNIIKEDQEDVIIYNSFSKSYIVLDKKQDTKCFFNIEEFNKLDDNDKKILIENGFVVEEERDEFLETKYIYMQKYFDNDILEITLVPSLACNFKCPYCFEKDLSCGKENIQKYFDILKKFAKKSFKNYKVVHISLFGGEPLIWYEKCIKFLEWAKKDSLKNNYNIVVGMVTNGSLLTLDKLENLIKNGLNTLQITLDSDRYNHDNLRIFKDGRPSFDLLIDKINMIAKHIDKRLKFIVRINLNNTTTEKVSETLKLIDKKYRKKVNLLLRAIYNTHSYEKENSNNNFDLKKYYDISSKLGFKMLNEKYKYQTCEACGDRKNFYLMPDLSMWKCINDLRYFKAKFGQIDENGEINLISSNIVDWYNNCTSQFDDPECKNCKLLPDCLGGCPLYKCKNKCKSCRSFDMVSQSIFYDKK